MKIGTKARTAIRMSTGPYSPLASRFVAVTPSTTPTISAAAANTSSDRSSSWGSVSVGSWLSVDHDRKCEDQRVVFEPAIKMAWMTEDTTNQSTGIDAASSSAGFRGGVDPGTAGADASLECLERLRAEPLLAEPLRCAPGEGDDGGFTRVSVAAPISNDERFRSRDLPASKLVPPVHHRRHRRDGPPPARQGGFGERLSAS